MINRQISVHLQNFPEVAFLDDEKRLVADMDLVRTLCSVVLSIRDNKNLRVRLPLNKLIVIGKKAARILPFREIIADEVNVKSIEIKEEISDLAELKLQLNFKKIGAKFGAKIKEITKAAKCGAWKKIEKVTGEEIAGEEIAGEEIEIAGVKLSADEFEIKLAGNNNYEKKFVTAALPNNDYLLQLDIEITKELEDEGIARDIVRAVQQNRKDANLNISEHIKFKIFSADSRIITVAKAFESYIKEQVLAEMVQFSTSLQELKDSAKFFYQNKLENGDLAIGIL
jgi:isoleucyl-tRNA synthetase